MAQEKLLPQVATHDLFGQFRFIKTDDGEIYFAAVDVAKVLGIKKVRNTIANFLDNEKMTVHIMGGHSEKRGGARSLVFINEPGLYRLIFMSRKPEAKKFQDWVYHEVLPSIRKNGYYVLPQQEETQEETSSNIIIDGVEYVECIWSDDDSNTYLMPLHDIENLKKMSERFPDFKIQRVKLIDQKKGDNIH